MSETRKLAAILAADVVGYSRLAGADEDRILARLRALRSDLIDPTIAVHNGRVVKRTGDGSIVEFRSVVDAVRCAIEVQTAMVERNAGVPPERQIVFRIGIHLGDVVEESDGDLMGDGVNIAARLEGMAAPGAICLSEDAYRQVKGRLDLAVTDLGPTHLKNIAEPIRAYALQVGVAAHATPTPPPEPARLALPDKPSIAVLAFQNMSGDPEQEYFADGVVEEIITALSRIRWLFVIARNSSFSYKGRAVDVKKIGRELGVRYILEGSVRRAGSRMRITGQLIDASNGVHLWADRFEGQLEDIFDLQDQVTARVVGAIAPRLEQAEIERAKYKPTENLSAYDYYLRGLSFVNQWTREANKEALRMFNKAIELDPNFASAYGMAARCYSQRKAGGWGNDRVEDITETERLARRAAELGVDDAVALCTAGVSLSFVVGKNEDGADLINRALELNPNLAAAWLFSGWVNVWGGEPEIAIERVANALRLSPQDPQIAMMQAATACAHFFAGRIAEASLWAEKSVRIRPDYYVANGVLVAINAVAGRVTDAEKSMARLRQINPALRISNLSDSFPIQRPDYLTKWVDAFRKAGLPE